MIDRLLEMLLTSIKVMPIDRWISNDTNGKFD